MFSHSREVFQRATLQGYLGLRKLDQHITDDDILAFHSLNLAFLKAKSFSCRFKEVRSAKLTSEDRWLRVTYLILLVNMIITKLRQ